MPYLGRKTKTNENEQPQMKFHNQIPTKYFAKHKISCHVHHADQIVPPVRVGRHRLGLRRHQLCPQPRHDIRQLRRQVHTLRGVGLCDVRLPAGHKWGRNSQRRLTTSVYIIRRLIRSNEEPRRRWVKLRNGERLTSGRAMGWVGGAGGAGGCGEVQREGTEFDKPRC